MTWPPTIPVGPLFIHPTSRLVGMFSVGPGHSGLVVIVDVVADDDVASVDVVTDVVLDDTISVVEVVA